MDSTVTIKRTTGRKTTPQNSYLHVLFSIVADTLNAEGMGDGAKVDDGAREEWCKGAGLLPDRRAYGQGRDGPCGEADKELADKEEAMVTIDRVIQYWAELGIVLPEPNEQMEMEIAD